METDVFWRRATMSILPLYLVQFVLFTSVGGALGAGIVAFLSLTGYVVVRLGSDSPLRCALGATSAIWLGTAALLGVSLLGGAG